ncbi:hypothetical protein FPV67DRAFT_1451169 [Lyophyllum atratum]|nr:hypothetical protein FPV67DRAFT_1451169 [Lyophyllum atratum]
MPARSAKHGRSSKTSRNPPVAPAPTAELLVDFDPFHASENTYEGEALPRSDIDTAPPSEFSTPAEPPSRLPVHEQEEPGEEEASLFHHDPSHHAPNDIIHHEPEPEPEPDTDALPPIPIPVPRSQTPQLLPPPPPSHQQRPFKPELSPTSLNTNRFSYGYAHPPPPTQTPKSQHPNSNPNPVSGLARTIRAPIHAGAGTGTPAKRFTAPLSMAPAAPAIVDLGTASREFGFGGVGDGHGHEPVGGRQEGKGRGTGKEEVVWARWDVLDTCTGPHPRQHKRLLFVAYASTLQIWDTTDLEGISEVLKMPFARLGLEGEEERGGAVLVHAAVLPRRVARRMAGNEEGEEGCLIGLAFDSGAFVVYSLTTHHVVTRFTVGSRGKGKERGARIESFQASREFIVISTTSPPRLHVYSANTYTPLCVVPDSKLTPYVPPPSSEGAAGVGVGSSALGASAKAVLASAFAAVGGGNVDRASTSSGWAARRGLYDATSPGSHSRSNSSYDATNVDAKMNVYGGDTMYHNHHNHHYNHNHHAHTPTSNINTNTHPSNPNVSPPYLDAPPPPPPPPHAVYALSHRLLAYASPAPLTSPQGQGPSNPAPSSSVPPETPMSLGGSVWGGMRTLGGLAVSAARSRMAGAGEGAGGVGKFFSRSAPEQGEAGVGTEREREGRGRRDSEASSGTSGSAGGEGGYYVTVVDLGTLVRGQAQPETVVEFLVGRDRAVAGLVFAGDGCSVGVVPRDGQAVQVYQIRPSPSPSPARSSFSAGGGEPSGGGGEKEGSAWHLYNLRRGRTSAVVEGVEWAGDGRWVAVGTRRGTVHVFGVNPYGGKTDVKSHLEGRVRNVGAPQPMPTEMVPIVRLRAGATTAVGLQPRAPLAFTFITSDESTLPAHLLPPRTASTPPPHAQHAPSRSYASSDPGSPPPPVSPRRARNFQDVLLFDPGEGSLSLRRVTLEMRAREQGLAAAALGAATTSISLPGMGGAGRLSASPGSGQGHGQRSSSRSRAGMGMGQAMEVPMELVGRESTVMTWRLRREGGEVRKIMGGQGEEGGNRKGEGRGRADWLAQAELSTCSKSPKILPRPVYLSHQFSFHTLGEDYHALIRRYQFDIGGVKIDVRREVQVSAYSAGSGESFVEGFAAPRDIRHRTLSSSFDEPLASALTNELDHPHTSGVLPMLPNGTPTSRPQSFRNAIPIRTIGDGMSESLGRIRREINKVRSPRLKPRPDSSMSASVPLEFDEEDEDFLGRDMDLGADGLDVPSSVSRDTSRGGGDSSGPTVSTPATSAHALDEEEEVGRGLEKAEDAWGGWSSEDKLAVEEVERFDNIDVLGLLDEEQTPVRPVVEAKRKGRARRRG